MSADSPGTESEKETEKEREGGEKRECERILREEERQTETEMLWRRSGSEKTESKYQRKRERKKKEKKTKGELNSAFEDSRKNSSVLFAKHQTTSSSLLKQLMLATQWKKSL